MADPPVEVGAIQLTVACALPAVAVTEVGTPGDVAGVAVTVELDAEVPPELIAETRKSYEVPLVRPVAEYDVVGLFAARVVQALFM